MNQKNEKGITLIALVITIIVLLLLAGVSISMLSGEEGILYQASEAKNRIEKKAEEEQVNLVIAEEKIPVLAGYKKEIDIAAIKDKLQKQLNDKTVEVTKDEATGEITIKTLRDIYKINAKFEMVEEDESLTGLEAGNWEIAEDGTITNKLNATKTFKVGDKVDFAGKTDHNSDWYVFGVNDKGNLELIANKTAIAQINDVNALTNGADFIESCTTYLNNNIKINDTGIKLRVFSDTEIDWDAGYGESGYAFPGYYPAATLGAFWGFDPNKENVNQLLLATCFWECTDYYTGEKYTQPNDYPLNIIIIDGVLYDNNDGSGSNPLFPLDMNVGVIATLSDNMAISITKIQ